MRTSDFDYNLSHELIAQEPQSPRDACKLLVLDRHTGAMEHKKFFEITKYMRAGDVLVLNNTKVFKARLQGHLQGNPRSGVEIFLLKPMKMDAEQCMWEALGKPGHKLEPGTVIEFEKGLCCTVGEKIQDGGMMTVMFPCAYGKFMETLEQIGHIPVPPYIKKEPRALEEYQTVYAENTGSVAAPTAGFHFTSELLEKVRALGVEVVELTLHVGIGTFKPVKTELVEEHIMHAEYVEISKRTAQVISAAKQEGMRVIACGTTSVRALEGVHRAECHSKGEASKICHSHEDGNPRRYNSGFPLKAGMRHTQQPALSAFTGEVNLFITPGFEFHIVDALITNFHLPKSTLLMLVSAFAGRGRILAAYEEAKTRGYTFFSFGDAMLII